MEGYKLSPHAGSANESDLINHGVFRVLELTIWLPARGCGHDGIPARPHQGDESDISGLRLYRRRLQTPAVRALQQPGR